MNEAEVVERLNAVQGELVTYEKMLRSPALSPAMRARCETRVVMYKGMRVALRGEWEALR